MTNDYRAEHHAALFGYLASEVFHRHPDEAPEVLKDAVITYGEERGGRMGKRAAIDGLPLNMNTYMLYREYPVEQDKFGGPSENLPNGDFHSSPEKCPWSTQWRDLGLDQYCGVYCRHIDNALARGFHPDVLIESKGNLTDGDQRCELWFYGANMDDPENVKKMREWGPRIKNSNAIKDFDYQLAHTYASISKTLRKYFPGVEADRLLAAAIEKFEALYGKGYADEFLALTGQDFINVSDYEGAPTPSE